MIDIGLAVGDSMLPTIKEGDLLLATTKIEGNLQGHIVLFKTGKKQFCHRVIEDRGDYVITKGDNLSHDDGEIPKDALAKM